MCIPNRVNQRNFITSLAFVLFEKVLRTIAHLVDSIHPTLAVTRVLVDALKERTVIRRVVRVHETLMIASAETFQRIVRLHLRHAHRDPSDAIVFSVNFVTSRHVRKRFGRVHHHLIFRRKKNGKKKNGKFKRINYFLEIINAFKRSRNRNILT